MSVCASNITSFPEIRTRATGPLLPGGIASAENVIVSEPDGFGEMLEFQSQHTDALLSAPDRIPTASLEVPSPRCGTSFSCCSSTNSVLSDCILNAAHGGYPLLGSPNTCGFWSPLERCQSPVESFASENCPPLYSPLCAPTMEPSCGDLWHELFQVRRRLDCLTLEMKHMKNSSQTLSTNLKKLTTRVDRLVQVAGHFRKDLSDVAYLEQIVHVLNGDLEHVYLHKWPFRILRPCSHEELDLIV